MHLLRTKALSLAARLAVVASMTSLAYGSNVSLGRVDVIREAERNGAWDMDDAIYALSDYAEQTTVPYHLRSLADFGAWVLVIIWLYRSAKNAERIRPSELRHTPSWAIFGWFVPVLNLIRPFQVVRDTWRASDPDGSEHQRTVLVVTWWALILASLGTGLYEIQKYLLANSFDEAITSTHLRIAATLLYMLAGLPLIAIIQKVTGLQARAMEQPASKK